MAELADATDLKSVGCKTVRVQVPLSPNKLRNLINNFTYLNIIFLRKNVIKKRFLAFLKTTT